MLGKLPDSDQPILLFDGVCNLCNGFVQFIIRRDAQQQFRFSSLQSGTGRRVLQYIADDAGSVPDSLILLYKGRYYTKADAALKIAMLLGGGWRLMGAGYILPGFIRNAIYDLVARNRYKWFGKQDECMIPTPELSSRFLD